MDQTRGFGAHLRLMSLVDLQLNGPILNISQIMRNIMSSAAEAETGSLFINTKTGYVLRNTLEDMGHKQPPTPVQIDNSTTAGFVQRTIKVKRSKAFDMRFYWIQDRVDQKQFLVYWRPGRLNLADYFTKFHPPRVVQEVKQFYMLTNSRYNRREAARVC